MVPFERALVSCYKPSIRIISVSAIVCPKFQIAILGGGCEPIILGKRRPQWVRDGTVRKRLVSFYRPSQLFLYLYAFQRYCLFCSLACHFFPTLPLVSPKFPQVPLGLGGSPFSYKERRCLANCPCNQFSRFPTYVITIHQRHRRTDRRTDDMRSQDRAFALKCIAR